eukprot:scaffold1060_cov40-Phaeocystis_antarctica.AAC.3
MGCGCGEADCVLLATLYSPRASGGTGAPARSTQCRSARHSPRRHPLLSVYICIHLGVAQQAERVEHLIEYHELYTRLYSSDPLIQRYSLYLPAGAPTYLLTYLLLEHLAAQRRGQQEVDVGRVGVRTHELDDEWVLRLRHIGWHTRVNGAPLYTVCPLLRWQPGCGELQLGPTTRVHRWWWPRQPRCTGW